MYCESLEDLHVSVKTFMQAAVVKKELPVDTCYMCGRTGAQVSEVLIQDLLRDIDAKIAALAKEKESLNSQFGDVTALWNDLNIKIKNLKTDLLSFNLETLEKNFGNLKSNVVADVLEFMKKSPELKIQNISLEDVIANFEKYRPSTLRLDQIKKELVELELRKRDMAEKLGSTVELLETIKISVREDGARSRMHFERAENTGNGGDYLEVKLCLVCSALLGRPVK